MLTKLFRRSRKPRTAAVVPGAHGRQVRPALESLESRELLSATTLPIPNFSPAFIQALTPQAPLLSGSQLSPASITNVVVQNGQLIANGFLEGIPFTAPITLSTTAGTTSGATPILHLQINAIHLNLLGLTVDTSNICLSITAQPGSGNLLGNLLSNLANSLNGGTSSTTALSNLSATDTGTLTSGVSSLLDTVTRNLTAPSAVTTSGTGTILNLTLGPVNLNLLGLNVALDNCANGPITVAVSAVPGPGNLLGNLLSDLTHLADATPASITNSVVQNGQLVANGLFGNVPFTAPISLSASPGTIASAPILHLQINALHLNLLGLTVDTSNICLTITAQAGSGGALGTLLNNIANQLNGGASSTNVLNGLSASDFNTLTTGVTSLLGTVVQDLTAPSAVTTSGTGNILNLTLGPVNLNLLGLNVALDNCANGPITVAVSAVPGPGNLLGNLLSGLTHSLDSLPATLTGVTLQNGQLLATGLLGGIPFTAPLLLSATPGATSGATPILHLQINAIHLNLLGLTVDTSNICLNITAQSGSGALGSLLSTIANQLNGGASSSSVLNGLSPTDLNTLTTGVTSLLGAVLSDITSAVAMTSGTSSAATTGATNILNLSLGPVSLNLLGLNVNLDNCAGGPVTVTVAAQPGPGNLLGNLLSDLAHLADNRSIIPSDLFSQLLAGNSGNATQAFINGLYQTLLGRNGDSAGIAYWVNLLQNSGMTTAQIVQQFLNSTEFRGREVDSFYQRYLHRTESAAERAFWVGQLESGVDESTVIQGFLTSQEFNNASVSDTTFIETLYGSVLSRAASTTDLAYWLNQLSSGQTRQMVANSFLHSTEVFSNLVDSTYQTFLNRASDPGGKDYWIKNLASGTVTDDSFLAQFLSSQEFMNRTQGK